MSGLKWSPLILIIACVEIVVLMLITIQIVN